MTKRYHRKSVPILAKEPHVKMLFKFMDRNGITLADAAERSGISPPVISNWRSGVTHGPRIDLFASVCEAVGLVLSVELAPKRRNVRDPQQLELLL